VGVDGQVYRLSEGRLLRLPEGKCIEKGYAVLAEGEREEEREKAKAKKRSCVKCVQRRFRRSGEILRPSRTLKHDQMRDRGFLFNPVLSLSEPPEIIENLSVLNSLSGPESAFGPKSSCLP